MNNPPETTQPDAHIVEGLTGRLPFLVGGIVFFFVLSLMMRLRVMLHPDIVVIDFDTIAVWGTLALVLMLLITPLLHQAIHALVALSLHSGLTVSRRFIFPRVRPAMPLSRTQAIWFLLAPLVVSLVALLLLAVRSLALFVALFNAVNIALSVNDGWKVLGLLRVSRTAQVQVNTDHCRILSR